MDCEDLFIGDDDGSSRVEYNEQDLQHYKRENEAVGNLKDWVRGKDYECIVLHSKMELEELEINKWKYTLTPPCDTRLIVYSREDRFDNDMGKHLRSCDVCKGLDNATPVINRRSSRTKRKVEEDLNETSSDVSDHDDVEVFDEEHISKCSSGCKWHWLYWVH